jgi:hypothetical protein
MQVPVFRQHPDVASGNEQDHACPLERTAHSAVMQHLILMTRPATANVQLSLSVRTRPQCHVLLGAGPVRC